MRFCRSDVRSERAEELEGGFALSMLCAGGHLFDGFLAGDERFAVVAEEVRNLAARSAKAAKETAELIESSVEKTVRGTAIAERTSTALDEIVSSITKVTDLVSEIAAASSEQAQGINQISIGLQQIDSVVQQTTANAEESAATSEELSSQTAHLNSILSRFKLKADSDDFRPGQKEPLRLS